MLTRTKDELARLGYALELEINSDSFDNLDPQEQGLILALETALDNLSAYNRRERLRRVA